MAGLGAGRSRALFRAGYLDVAYLSRVWRTQASDPRTFTRHGECWADEHHGFVLPAHRTVAVSVGLFVYALVMYHQSPLNFQRWVRLHAAS